jgi:hypothetical protein
MFSGKFSYQKVHMRNNELKWIVIDVETVSEDSYGIIADVMVKFIDVAFPGKNLSRFSAHK